MGGKRRNTEEFIKEMCVINPNIEIIGDFTGTQNPILVKCKIDGHEWSPIGNSLLRKQGCPKCAGNIKKTQEEFVEEIKHINKDILILGTYKTRNDRIECKCIKCGNEWNPLASDVFNFRGCPECAKISRRKNRTKKHDIFKNELELVNKDIELLSKYIKAKEYITCRCKMCGNIWEAYPDALRKGSGCPECFKVRMRKTNDEFIKELKMKNPTISPIETYTGSENKIKVKCLKCNNEWSTTPHSLTKGTGCPSCNISKGENKVSEYLKTNKIYYQPQKKYDSLLGVGNGKLSYDFYLPTYNILIEYQGEQHIRAREHFGGECQLEIQKEHDKRKKEYALNNGIKLLEIWYWDFDNIIEILTREIFYHPFFNAKIKERRYS